MPNNLSRKHITCKYCPLWIREIRIIIVLLISIGLAICCSRNPASSESDCDYDGCTYEGIKLDTTDVSLNVNDVLATWSLEAFVDLSNCTAESLPEDYFGAKPNVVFSFLDSNKLSGYTSNRIGGNYSVADNKIVMNVHGTTEINEHKWSIKFLEASTVTDYGFSKNSKLFVFYNQSSQVMVFTKI